MSSLLETIQALREAGMSDADILRVVENRERHKRERNRLQSRERMQRYRSAKSENITENQQSVTRCERNERNTPSLKVLPPHTPQSPKPTPAKENPPKGGQKKGSPSLDELAVDHVVAWLAKKRSEGRYIHHDEHRILEVFKDYCKSKGVKYKDYVAAYRNAFDWQRCRPDTGNQRPNKTDRAKAAVLRAAERGGYAFQRH